MAATRKRAIRLVWPLMLTVLAVCLMAFADRFPVRHQEAVSVIATALVFFASAWLISRTIAFALDQAATRRRPYPRLLKDLIAAILFFVALVSTVALANGQGLIGALAGSGIALALLGFAIRNVVADTLSGIALGIEGPYRIGDWVDIDGLARGRVVEIGWRTTRLLTADATYMILPNSQIARQRITNFSAPRAQYRTRLTITLDHGIPVEVAKRIMAEVLARATLILRTPAPDVRVIGYENGGIAYALRYWLARFDVEVDCRDELCSLLDQAFQKAGVTSPRHRVQLIHDESPYRSQIPEMEHVSGVKG